MWIQKLTAEPTRYREGAADDFSRGAAITASHIHGYIRAVGKARLAFGDTFEGVNPVKAGRKGGITPYDKHGEGFTTSMSSKPSWGNGKPYM